MQYTINFVRIEHQVHRICVQATSVESALEAAADLVDSDDFDWDNHKVVHAEEFFQDVNKQVSLSRDLF